MKVSLSWLKEYVSFSGPIQDLSDALTMAGLEVDAVFDRYTYLEKILVGRVATVIDHPNADKLKLCTVQTGDNLDFAVVCGAPNVKPGMLAPLALPGAVMPDGTVIRTGTIRGEKSHGMLCSEFELGLGTDQSGIMTLTDTCCVGDTLAKALTLSDMVLDIDLTPNRPDCLSILGTAREVAALTGLTVNYPDTLITDSEDRISKLTSVTIKAPADCPRYAARIVDGITIGPSPFWLQDRLVSIGLRPINNIVDITNFVMMETGQPLHAFDLDHLAGNRIVVRRAAKGEVFQTLDGKNRILSDTMLMICDADKPVAIAGVMGGLNSEVTPTTTRVLIESACFDPVSIRKTAKAIGLNTDASHRFERGVDPDGTIKALNRAARLMAEIGNGYLVKGIVDEHPGPQKARIINLPIKDVNRLLGTDISAPKAAALLTAIEFKVENTASDMLVVTVPTFRVDVTRPVDLMEEIARLWGYDRIPITNPPIPSEARQQDNRRLTLRRRIKQLMTGFGFMEVINYSFINRHSCDRLRLEGDDPRRQHVEILNPLTEDQAVLRTSLVPGLLETAHLNTTYQEKNLTIFETGKTFINQGHDKQGLETEAIAALWTGNIMAVAWHTKARACDFFDIKGVAEALLSGLNYPNVAFTSLPDDRCCYTKPGHSAQISINGKAMGIIGEVHPEVLGAYDLKQAVFVFEMNVDALLTVVTEDIQARPIPRFPSTDRDITLIFDKNLESGAILANLENFDEPLLENIRLFDVYEGAPIPDGKKSISFRLTYCSSDETLEDETVNRLHKNITERLLALFDATLPS